MESKHADDNKRLHVRVTGRVQGVYYRASTCTEARRLGVSGWVRNTHDGAVEIEVQGAPGAVAEFVAWCHKGPPAARVERVETRVLEVLPTAAAGEVGFSVRR